MGGDLGDILPQIPGSESWKAGKAPSSAGLDRHKGPRGAVSGQEQHAAPSALGQGPCTRTGWGLGTWPPGSQTPLPHSPGLPNPSAAQYSTTAVPTHVAPSSQGCSLPGPWLASCILSPTRLRPALRVAALRASCARWCLCPSLLC